MEGIQSIVPLILIFAIMWFLLIRPQQKKIKEHKAMVDAVRKGDQVITQGGIIGKITRVKDADEVEIEIASKASRSVRSNPPSRRFFPRPNPPTIKSKIAI